MEVISGATILREDHWKKNCEAIGTINSCSENKIPKEISCAVDLVASVTFAPKLAFFTHNFDDKEYAEKLKAKHLKKIAFSLCFNREILSRKSRVKVPPAWDFLRLE